MRCVIRFAAVSVVRLDFRRIVTIARSICIAVGSETSQTLDFHDKIRTRTFTHDHHCVWSWCCGAICVFEHDDACQQQRVVLHLHTGAGCDSRRPSVGRGDRQGLGEPRYECKLDPLVASIPDSTQNANNDPEGIQENDSIRTAIDDNVSHAPSLLLCSLYRSRNWP